MSSGIPTIFNRVNPAQPAAKSSGYTIVQDEGTALAAQSKMNFVGAGVVVTNDGPNSRTNVTIAGSAVTAITGGVAGRVVYFDGATTIAGEAELFWDATNNRLGIGTATPSTDLHVLRSATGTTVTATVENTSTSSSSNTSILSKAVNTTGAVRSTRATFDLEAGNADSGAADDNLITTGINFTARSSSLSPTTKSFKIGHRPHPTANSLNLFSDSIISGGGIQTWTRGGLVGIGIAAPLGKLVVNGSITSTATSTTLNTADPTLSVGDTSYIRLTLGALSSGNITLGDGVHVGQRLVIECVSNSGTAIIPDSTTQNVVLSIAWTPTAEDTLSLIWNGSNWVELARSIN
jgi:hypothetical protein